MKDLADGSHYLAGHFLFHDVSPCAGPYHPLRVQAGFVVHGENQYRQWGFMPLVEVFYQIQAAGSL